MPATLDVSCPKCGKTMKVPSELEGKKIKCKDCQMIFPVGIAAKAAKPVKAASATPVKPAAAPPPEPPAKPKSPFLDDDEEDEKNPKPMGVIHEDDIPRCPHCAKELEPPDAKVCVHCGFNNLTRMKADTKKTIAADASDWMTHLGPGILALIIAVALIVVDIICLINMNEWVAGSDLEKEDKDPVTGKVQYYVKPGALTTMVIAASVIVIIPAIRFAVYRLIIDYKPEEKLKK